jgi:hypothetical protein
MDDDPQELNFDDDGPRRRPYPRCRTVDEDDGERDETIRELYRDHTAVEIAARLGMTDTHVQSRIAKLGLSKRFARPS